MGCQELNPGQTRATQVLCPLYLLLSSLTLVPTKGAEADKSLSTEGRDSEHRGVQGCNGDFSLPSLDVLAHCTDGFNQSSS